MLPAAAMKNRRDHVRMVQVVNVVLVTCLSSLELTIKRDGEPGIDAEFLRLTPQSPSFT